MPLVNRLAQNRFAPLQEYLSARDGLPPVRRLVVLPSSYVASLPVELIAPAGLQVSYAPSGSLLTYVKTLPEREPAGMLALGDPEFELSVSSLAEAELPPAGVLITMVAPGSNAARHGLKSGDVLLAYDGKQLLQPADLAVRAEGPAVVTRVWRLDELGKASIRELEIAPGKLGLVMAKEPAPVALKKQRETDKWLLTLRFGSNEFAPLPGSAVEVQRLRDRFQRSNQPAPVHLGLQAAEPQLAELAAADELKKYRYLHFATHGVIDHDRPSRSALILSQVGLPDPAEQFEQGLPVYDGRVTVEEIVEQWDLGADLVVLSACETALGPRAGGEGFIGFAQALLTAGARSVVLSLWKVDDMATALLMDRFYGNLLGQTEGLEKPMGKAEALSEAKRWLREMPSAEATKLMANLTAGIDRAKGRVERPAAEGTLAKPAKLPEGDKPFAHPYYWAAFILIGDPD
jgi:hypothetical protein